VVCAKIISESILFRQDVPPPVTLGPLSLEECSALDEIVLEWDPIAVCHSCVAFVLMLAGKHIAHGHSFAFDG
jgi:hypothetical protein